MRTSLAFAFTASTVLGCAAVRTDCPNLLLPAGPSELGWGPCTASGGGLDCHPSDVLVAGPDVTRGVRLRLPVGDPPDGGWPVVLAFQGGYFSPAYFFRSSGRFDLFGATIETQVVARLLADGYAVVAPDTVTRNLVWQTDLPWIANKWRGSSDDLFVRYLFELIDKGGLGPLNGKRLYAVGISSGGYMASRMAVSYPGKFKAVAIESASYATCLGPFCSVPADLPVDHPPTLFLHGLLDAIIPVSTMEPYRLALRGHGREACEIVHTWAGHRWIPEAPLAVVRWFDSHR